MFFAGRLVGWRRTIHMPAWAIIAVPGCLIVSDALRNTARAKELVAG